MLAAARECALEEARSLGLLLLYIREGIVRQREWWYELQAEVESIANIWEEGSISYVQLEYIN